MNDKNESFLLSFLNEIFIGGGCMMVTVICQLARDRHTRRNTFEINLMDYAVQ